MNRFNIETEKAKWEHPYRIQVTKPLRWYELETFIKKNASAGADYAIEKRTGKFVLWRAPELEWDVDKASPEWLEEWTSQEPPPLEAFIKEFRIELKKEKVIMPKSENVLRRDDSIRAEFEQYKKQGFQSGHIYRVLAEKFYLSPYRIRDIVTLTKNKLPNLPK